MMTNKKAIYEKAVASVVYFDNGDVITSSGGNGCVTWSSENGHVCHGALQLTEGDLKPPLS